MFYMSKTRCNGTNVGTSRLLVNQGYAFVLQRSKGDFCFKSILLLSLTSVIKCMPKLYCIFVNLNFFTLRRFSMHSYRPTSVFIYNHTSLTDSSLVISACDPGILVHRS